MPLPGRYFVRLRSRLTGRPDERFSFSEKGHAVFYFDREIHGMFGREVFAEGRVRREQEVDQVNIFYFIERQAGAGVPVGGNTADSGGLQNIIKDWFWEFPGPAPGIRREAEHMLGGNPS